VKAKNLLFVLPPLLMGMLLGCEVGSPNNVTPVTSGNYAGVYTNPTNGVLVTGNTGAAVTSLTITQFGSQLNGVDNNGILFHGTVVEANTNDASFTLNGATTTGAAVTITGSFQGSSSYIMSGTWSEPTVSVIFYGQD